MKVLIYIVCYNAQKHIYSVLNRIPLQYRNDPSITIIISDDCSSDDTARTALAAAGELGYTNYKVFKTKLNQGYGGNQKIGYNYACKNNFDYVILLHGDGQYAPEELGKFFESFKDGADVVLGSRMLQKKDALKGRMPFLRFVSNIILTRIQNFLAQTNLSEFHTGYRAFSVKFLREIPFELNSDDFDFDTDILLQAKFLQKNIKEFAISTFYGTQKSNVKLIKYGLDILKTSMKFKLQQMGIGCQLKFRGSKQLVYKDKSFFKFTTHSELLKIIDKYQPKRILDIASGSGFLGQRLRGKDIWITGIDVLAHSNDGYSEFFYENIEDFAWDRISGKFDMVCLMDALEHLKEPEKLLLNLRNNPKLEDAVFVISVPNVAFFSIRIGLLFGRFNYADRGIMDIGHKRLFTYSSFGHMLKECGFKVKKTISIPPPFKAVNKNFISDLLTLPFNLLSKFAPGLFSFQVLKIAVPKPTSTKVINNLLSEYDQPVKAEN